jgi:predicted RNA-binding protein associated with RNAse of E/G family
MAIKTQLERDEDSLYRELEEGLLTNAEYNRALRELYADYRAVAEESAREAYDRELDRW